MMVNGYNQFGATERVAGAIRNILEFEGITAPHTGEPYTEALLLGIGGGIGAEYATWAFTGIDPSRPKKSQLYLRFHHTKNYLEKNENTILQKIAKRLGAKLIVKETSSQKQATQFLFEGLRGGKPILTQLSVWHSIHMRHKVKERYYEDPNFFPPLLYDEHVLFLPYYNLPYSWISGHLAIVYGIDEVSNLVYLTDYSNKPHNISHQHLVESRSIIKGWKNAAYYIQPPPTQPDLASAIRLGIRDCTESLLHKKAVISGAHLRVQAWHTIANSLNDYQGKGGWLTLFSEPWQLYDTFTRLHAQIAFYNSDGGALRSSYADFLEEASIILNKPSLRRIAHQFSDIGIMWDEIGTTTLHDDIPELQNTRHAALEWHNTYKVHGSSATQTLEILSKKIQAIRSQFSESMPLTERELQTLLEELSVRFHEVFEAEKNALQALRIIMK